MAIAGASRRRGDNAAAMRYVRQAEKGIGPIEFSATSSDAGAVGMTVYLTPSAGAVGDGVAVRPFADGFSGSTLLQRIRRVADAVSTVRCQATPSSVQVEPIRPDGLPVAVYRHHGRQTVCIGGWYDDVDDDEEVLNLVKRAIHGSLRLRMDSDGRTTHRFAVETLECNGAWIEIGQMTEGYWFRKRPSRVVKYLCNKNGATPAQPLANNHRR